MEEFSYLFFVDDCLNSTISLLEERTVKKIKLKKKFPCLKPVEDYFAREPNSAVSYDCSFAVKILSLVFRNEICVDLKRVPLEQTFSTLSQLELLILACRIIFLTQVRDDAQALLYQVS